MAIATLEKVEKSKIKNWSVIIRDQTKASSKRPKVTFTIWDFCLQLRNIQLLVFSTSCTNNDLIKKWTFLIIQVYKSQQCRGNRITKHESILSRVFFFFISSFQSSYIFRGTQREYSSKPLKQSIFKRVLVFKRWIWAYFISYKFFICSDFLAESLVIQKL